MYIYQTPWYHTLDDGFCNSVVFKWVRNFDFIDDDDSLLYHL